MLKGLEDYTNCREAYEDFANAIILSCLDDYRAWFKEHYRKHPNLTYKNAVDGSIVAHSNRDRRLGLYAATAVSFLTGPDVDLYSKIPGKTLIEFVEQQIKENPKKRPYRTMKVASKKLKRKEGTL